MCVSALTSRPTWLANQRDVELRYIHVHIRAVDVPTRAAAVGSALAAAVVADMVTITV